MSYPRTRVSMVADGEKHGPPDQVVGDKCKGWQDISHCRRTLSYPRMRVSMTAEGTKY